MLLVGLGDMSYGYYVLLRFAVATVAVFVVVVAVKIDRTWAAWTFGLAAVLFNPIVPIGIGQPAWHVLDVVLAALFLIVAARIHRLPSPRKAIPMPPRTAREFALLAVRGTTAPSRQEAAKSLVSLVGTEGYDSLAECPTCHAPSNFLVPLGYALARSEDDVARLAGDTLVELGEAGADAVVSSADSTSELWAGRAMALVPRFGAAMIPTLLRYLFHEDINSPKARFAADALWALGEEAIRPMLKELEDVGYSHWNSVAPALQLDGTTAVPALLEFLRAANHCSPALPVVVDALELLSRLDHVDPKVRRRICGALAKFSASNPGLRDCRSEVTADWDEWERSKNRA
jgi:hypothetical protein